MSLPTNTGPMGPMTRRSMILAAIAITMSTKFSSAAPNEEASSLVRPGDPILGNPKGNLTIVDFYDIRCPPCRAMDTPLKKLLRADNEIRYVPVDYPILGPASELGTRALFAAQMQDKYQAFRDMLLREPHGPTDASLEADAKTLSLDWPRLELDMNGDAVASHVAENLSRGQALGLHGIPALFVGPVFVPGELSYADLVSVVAMARAKKADGKPS